VIRPCHNVKEQDELLTYDVKDDRNQDQLCPAEDVGDLGCCWLLYKGVMKSSSSRWHGIHRQSRSKKALACYPICPVELTCAAAPITLRTTVIVDNNECWAYEAVA
jgi:hypothetical protein